MGPLPQLKDEEGFALLEVIVSAALLAVMVIAVFTTFDVDEPRLGRGTGSRAVAASLAQDEQERLRSMPVRLTSRRWPTWARQARPDEPRHRRQGHHKITSTVSWLRDDTQSATCTRTARPPTT